MLLFQVFIIDNKLDKYEGSHQGTGGKTSSTLKKKE